LAAAGDQHFPAALELAREKDLLRLLLKLQAGNEERTRQVHAAYAEALEAKNLQEDAGGVMGDGMGSFCFEHGVG
jgi:elongator complex protein 1